ncbi:4-phosphoerythronate dehydrogenase [secondary endosymbiont of Ctenarytaina eucalypti]|uniref:4-phosphoerythronate dehydrogenase n=1 Tax=secondary endosymbiont of Ctenarytaina eucalypti TaxID=1199245 RepID=UPI0005C49FFA|nr:4-phosphoerythronate dehydrogenase [secondary endosymbiont of Ctenarytaina eucalypti]
MRILVDENIPYAESLFGRLGDVDRVNGRDIPSPMLAQADALIVRSVTHVDSTLLRGSRITFVGTATSGTDHVDTAWLEQAGICFAAAPGCNAIAVAEYVFSTLLCLAQRDGFALRDKAVGIVGVGNVGGLLQRRLHAYGVRTLLCDPPLAEAGTLGHWQSLAQLVKEADILTFHTPLTHHGRNATWHLVDEALLEALQDDCIIINTCRGAVIDNDALLKTLVAGKPLRVVLDVWESEPALSLPLLTLVDVGTAHIAGYTLEGKTRGAAQIFDAYNAFIGSEVRANLAILLPSAMRSIHLHGDIDEAALLLLANLVYDVRHDDVQLRRMASLPGAFDRLRKQYDQRREWSSLCVKTDTSTDMLCQLGFSIPSSRAG